MSAQSRPELRARFANGLRPNEEDFANLFDSFLNIVEDRLSVDSDDLILPGGLALGDSARAQAGTLRLNAGNVQFHNGVDWVTLGAAGGGGAFESVGTSGEVAYAGGNVGIGAAFATSAPTFALEVDLDRNNGPEDRVRFGSVVCSRGRSGQATSAYLYQQDQDPQEDYAVRQDANGETFINAAANARIRLTQSNNEANPALTVTTGGSVVVRSRNPINGSTLPFQVNGNAGKTSGGGNWSTISDARVKEEVRDLDAGLDELLRVRPVRFRYNGRASTPAGAEEVGVLGQEIEQVFPEMVETVPGAVDGEEELEDLRLYNGSALTFVLVNAVKQLAAKVERLEAALSEGPSDGDDG